MDSDRKKIAAAISTAVQAYIQSETGQLPEGEQSGSPAQGAFRPYPVFSPWSLSGRQTMMDWRRQLQFRRIF